MRRVADEVGLVAEARPVGLDVSARRRRRACAASPATGASARAGPGPARPPRRRSRRPRRRPRRAAAGSPSPAWSPSRPGSGEIMIWPVSVCHQVSTIGQRSPPMTSWYQSHALGLIGSPTEPEQPQRREIVRVRVLGAPLHAGADRGRRGVEDRHPVALDELPPDVLVRDSRAPPRTSPRWRRWQSGP